MQGVPDRRSSILKSKPIDMTPRKKRRISFSEKKSVKEFTGGDNIATIWHTSYEESDASSALASSSTSSNNMLLSSCTQSTSTPFPLQIAMDQASELSNYKSNRINIPLLKNQHKPMMYQIENSNRMDLSPAAKFIKQDFGLTDSDFFRFLTDSPKRVKYDKRISKIPQSCTTNHNDKSKRNGSNNNEPCLRNMSCDISASNTTQLYNETILSDSNKTRYSMHSMQCDVTSTTSTIDPSMLIDHSNQTRHNTMLCDITNIAEQIPFDCNDNTGVTTHSTDNCQDSIHRFNKSIEDMDFSSDMECSTSNPKMCSISNIEIFDGGQPRMATPINQTIFCGDKMSPSIDITKTQNVLMDQSSLLMDSSTKVDNLNMVSAAISQQRNKTICNETMEISTKIIKPNLSAREQEPIEDSTDSRIDETEMPSTEFFDESSNTNSNGNDNSSNKSFKPIDSLFDLSKKSDYLSANLMLSDVCDDHSNTNETLQINDKLEIASEHTHNNEQLQSQLSDETFKNNVINSNDMENTLNTDQPPCNVRCQSCGICKTKQLKRPSILRKYSLNTTCLNDLHIDLELFEEYRKIATPGNILKAHKKSAQARKINEERLKFCSIANSSLVRLKERVERSPDGNDDELSVPLRMGLFPLCPSIEMLIENKFATETLRWRFNNQHFFAGKIFYRHVNVPSAIIEMTFSIDDINDYGVLYFKDIKLMTCPKATKDWGAIHFLRHSTLVSMLPLNLKNDCPTSTELFSFLNQMDQQYQSAYVLIKQLMDIAIVNDSFLDFDERGCFIHRTIFNDTTRTSQEIVIKIDNIHSIGPVNTFITPVRQFHYIIHSLPLGIEFVRQFLSEPNKYLLNELS